MTPAGRKLEGRGGERDGLDVSAPLSSSGATGGKRPRGATTAPRETQVVSGRRCRPGVARERAASLSA